MVCSVIMRDARSNQSPAVARLQTAGDPAKDRAVRPWRKRRSWWSLPGVSTPHSLDRSPSTPTKAKTTTRVTKSEHDEIDDDEGDEGDEGDDVSEVLRPFPWAHFGHSYR